MHHIKPHSLNLTLLFLLSILIFQLFVENVSIADPSCMRGLCQLVSLLLSLFNRK